MTQPSIVVRAIWFVLVGWWLTALVVNVAWALNVTVILAPLGVMLINQVPRVLTLAEPHRRIDPDGGAGQHSLVIRALYFVFLGWWLSFFWANLLVFAAITIIGLPVAIWMAHRLPYVTSLYRFHG